MISGKVKSVIFSFLAAALTSCGTEVKAASSQPAQFLKAAVIGDSIAAGINDHIRTLPLPMVDGIPMAFPGRHSNEILEVIKKYKPELQECLVVLSTGASNDVNYFTRKNSTKDIQAFEQNVSDQIDLLNEAHVKRIIIVGTGDRSDLETYRLNVWISQVAAHKPNVDFLGPLDPHKLVAETSKGKRVWKNWHLHPTAEGYDVMVERLAKMTKAFLAESPTVKRTVISDAPAP